MSSNNKDSLEIEYTCLFGKKEIDSKTYDVRDIVGKEILDYQLIKIKCQIKTGKGIYGIKLIYRNIITKEEKALINIESTEPNLIEQEMNLETEQILDAKFWFNDQIQLIGFEVITNLGSFQKFGYGDDEQLLRCHQLKKKDRVVVGFNVVENEGKGIIGMTLYHLNKRTYDFYMHSGIFSLRIKIKNENYKKDKDKKVDKMDKLNKLLYKVCSLPDNQFFNVIKFTLC